MSNKPLKLIPEGRPLEAPEAQTGSREQAVQRPLGEVHHIAQQEQIDEGGNADVAPVSDQAEQQHHGIHNHIQGSEVNGNCPVQPAHQHLKGVHAKSRRFHKANAHAADQDAEQRHKDSLSLRLDTIQNFHRNSPFSASYSPISFNLPDIIHWR